MTIRLARGVAVVAVVALAALVSWQEAGGRDHQDQYAFLPKGGAQLLQEVLEQCSGCEDFETVVSNRRKAEEWREYFEGYPDALRGLSPEEIETLVAYAAVNLPVAEPATGAVLPLDGSELLVQNCQFCHSIAVPVTQTKTLERWQAHIEVPPHELVEMNPTEWEELAHYLSINAPIPFESLPVELRIFGATY